jgi:hypothetical protein
MKFAIVRIGAQAPGGHLPMLQKFCRIHAAKGSFVADLVSPPEIS